MAAAEAVVVVDRGLVEEWRRRESHRSLNRIPFFFFFFTVYDRDLLRNFRGN